MVQFYEDSVSYAYSWAQTTLAFFARYPNPHSTHVLAGDIVDRAVREDGRLYTTRLLLKTGNTPKWARGWIKGGEGWILEETVVDPARRSMVARLRNLSYTRIMLVRERMTYEADGRTNVHIEAAIESNVRAGMLVRARIESFGHKRYAENSQKSRMGILHVLQQQQQQQQMQQQQQKQKQQQRK